MDTTTTFAELADTIMDIWWDVADDEGAPLEEWEIIEMSWAIRDEEIVNALVTSKNVEHLTVAAAVAGCRGISAAIWPLCRLWYNGIEDDWLREYVHWALTVIDPSVLTFMLFWRALIDFALMQVEQQRRNLGVFWAALSDYATTKVAEQGGWQPMLL